jgi:hypothetical protein
MWDATGFYELPTWAPHTDANDGSALLPTPSSSESTPTEEFVDETREAGIQPDERLYLPGRKWHSQRTLSRIAPALLPTPMANGENPGAGGELRAAIQHGPTRRNETGIDNLGRPNRGRTPLLPTPSANDATGAELETRQARQETGATGGPSLRDLPKLLPTPSARDQKGAGTKREGGHDLPLEIKLLPTPTRQDGKQNALNAKEAERNPHTMWAVMHRLLPTPQASDGTGGRSEKTAMRNDGKRPSGHKATLTLGTAVELSGELTSRPFADGNTSAADPHPGQLTIEDDSAPNSSNGCSDSPTDGQPSTP